MTLFFGYWDLRGSVEPIRLILHYAEVEFCDRRYKLGQSNQQELSNAALVMGQPSARMPFYIDDDSSVIGTMPILRYLGRKYGLIPDSVIDRFIFDSLEELGDKLGKVLFWVAHKPLPFSEDVLNYLSQTISSILTQFSGVLSNNTWFVGDTVTYIDFLIYEYVDQVSLLAPFILLPYSNLEEFILRVEALPAVQKYHNGSTYKSWPLYGPKANWGAKGQPPKRSIDILRILGPRP